MNNYQGVSQVILFCSLLTKSYTYLDNTVSKRVLKLIQIFLYYLRFERSPFIFSYIYP
uniref:Uncharacterized protein n=1 Tax=Lepeophtheirus salmonis TaxID=72036 RepID=A0A0K2T0H0_LEPSM